VRTIREFRSYLWSREPRLLGAGARARLIAARREATQRVTWARQSAVVKGKRGTRNPFNFTRPLFRNTWHQSRPSWLGGKCFPASAKPTWKLFQLSLEFPKGRRSGAGKSVRRGLSGGVESWGVGSRIIGARTFSLQWLAAYELQPAPVDEIQLYNGRNRRLWGQFTIQHHSTTPLAGAKEPIFPAADLAPWPSNANAGFAWGRPSGSSLGSTFRGRSIPGRPTLLSKLGPKIRNAVRHRPTPEQKNSSMASNFRIRRHRNGVCKRAFRHGDSGHHRLAQTTQWAGIHRQSDRRSRIRVRFGDSDFSWPARRGSPATLSKGPRGWGRWSKTIPLSGRGPAAFCPFEQESAPMFGGGRFKIGRCQDMRIRGSAERPGNGGARTGMAKNIWTYGATRSPPSRNDTKRK